MLVETVAEHVLSEIKKTKGRKKQFKKKNRKVTSKTQGVNIYAHANALHVEEGGV